VVFDAAFPVLPANRVVALSSGTLTVGGVTHGDLNGDTLVDMGETGELNGDAIGLVIEDFDFGMAIIRPTDLGDFAKYFALKASANGIELVGVPGATVHAENLLVEINQSSPSVYGNPLFPVVDFETSYPSEQQALFDALVVLLDANSNEILDTGELDGVLEGGYAGANISTAEQLVLLLDAGGAPPEILTVEEVLARFNEAFVAAHELDIKTADLDHDGKFDPAGYEVNTGGTPVYLDMNSPLIRAQGFVEINLFDTVYLTGSVAFELGPTHDVTLSDGITTKHVSTMTIGAADVTVFIGTGGPYWEDDDHDHEISDGELSDDAIGIHITDLDVGLVLMVSTDPDNAGVYVAGKIDLPTFGLVGIDGLTAEGSGDIEFNIGVGLSGGLEPDVAVVDFDASFNEMKTLYDLIDSDDSHELEQDELSAALAAGYTGGTLTTVQQLVTALNIGGAPQLGGPSVDDVLGKLSDDFKDDHEQDVRDADVDLDGKLDFGFEVNTGNPAAPVVLNFDDFRISAHIGGEIELEIDGESVFRLYGVFLFDADSSGLKAFVAAGLEFGPDVNATGSKIFMMSALGALVINEDGIAADIDISMSVGGALSSVLSLDVDARLVFNTTSADQEITIPERYVKFLEGTSTLPASQIYDTAQLSDLGLTGALDSRFTKHDDGSATFTIQGGAPRLDGTSDPDGPYFLISLSGDLTIASTFVISADFVLKISDTGLELGFNGEIDLGGFITLDVDGGAVIESGVFAAYVSLTVGFDVPGLDIHIGGGAVIEINTGSVDKDIFDAQGNKLATIDPNTFMVTINAQNPGIDLFGVLTAKGTVEIGVRNGVFSISLDADVNFFNVVHVDVSGYFRVAGNGSISFQFTGSLVLNLTAGSGATEFGIKGSLSVTVSNSGFTGHGDVDLVIFGREHRHRVRHGVGELGYRRMADPGRRTARHMARGKVKGDFAVLLH
jgi:hypothetical protein